MGFLDSGGWGNLKTNKHFQNLTKLEKMQVSSKILIKFVIFKIES